MQIVFFKCTNKECQATFGLDHETSMMTECFCPACSNEEFDEIAVMEVENLGESAELDARRALTT